MTTIRAKVEATVLRTGSFDMQVCVPAEWDDDAVKSFADRAVLCGTEKGWGIRKQGHAALAGCDERVPCAMIEGFVHIMMDA